MDGDNEVHERSVVVNATGRLVLRRVAPVGALAVAVVVGVQPLLGSVWFASELWLGVLASLVVLLLDGE